MGYQLEAIIVRANVLDNHQNAAWLPYVVELTQGYRILPLHDLVWKVVCSEDCTGSQEWPPESFETYAPQSLRELVSALSLNSIAAYIEVDCHGGPCDRWGVVYLDGNKIYDRHGDVRDEKPKFIWEQQRSFRLLSRLGFRSKWNVFPNPESTPSPTDEVFDLLGVSHQGHLDAWDALGIERYRDTREWPGGPEYRNIHEG